METQGFRRDSTTVREAALRMMSALPHIIEAAVRGGWKDAGPAIRQAEVAWEHGLVALFGRRVKTEENENV